MKPEDYFRGPGLLQRGMRRLLEREAALRAPRFGMERRRFLGGALGALAATAVAQQILRFASPAEAEDGFEPPREDCYAELRGDETEAGFDWARIQAAAHAQQSAVPETVLNMLRTQGSLYGGFGVTGLVHVTQTATRALRAQASDELVFLALLHDVGDVLSGLNHAEIVAALVRPYVSDGGYRLVRHHMEFQLAHYGDKVGQPVNMRNRYAQEPWYGDAVLLSDAWDQRSFDPDYDTLPLEEFVPLVTEKLSKIPKAELRTASDCPW